MGAKSQETNDQGLNAAFPRGLALLRDPFLNKGTAFTEKERHALGLRGLLPPHVHTQEEQVQRAMENYRRKATDLERYIYLVALQDRNITLFYRVLMDHLEEMLPIVYTPTVGLACQEYGHIFRRPRGLYLCAEDRGELERILRNWPHADARIIVVTDGERILGLGDLGVFGMGIPVGKLTLYTACGGIDPARGLPVTLDVGTENRALLRDMLYTGLRQGRLRGAEYDAFIEEFMVAAQAVFPRAVVQFEDFGNANAFRLLERYRNRQCCFNDDIQGTAAVTLAGICSALRITGGRLAEQKFLFLGAGEAGLGIGHLLVHALEGAGLGRPEALERCWFLDSQGLVVRERTSLAEPKRRFAHAHSPCSDLLSAIRVLRPTALIGTSGAPGAFTRAAIEAMAEMQERPIVFALSNPTSKAECTAEQAYTWSNGRAVFASGSPFPPVTLDGRTHVPGQVNNAYVFPGLGLGVVACEARRLTDPLFQVAATALAAQVTEEDLSCGRVLPPLSRIREVSAEIAVAVAEAAFADNLAGIPRPPDLQELIRSQMYQPRYRPYIG